jgi:hypothetical protein
MEGVMTTCNDAFTRSLVGYMPTSTTVNKKLGGSFFE